MKSESFRKQALSLVLFFAAVAAVFALTRLRSDPAKKQAEFVVQQLLSCSSAVEQAVDAAASSGSEPGLAAADTDGLYAFLQAQLGDAMTADCLDKVMANRLPTRITALAGQSGDKLVPADLTLKKRAGAENCYDFSAALLTATDSTAAAQVSGTITMVKEDGRYAVVLENARVELSEAKQANLARKQVQPGPITLGVRPEHISLAGDASQAVRGTVDVAEMMGSAVHLHVDACGRDTIVILQTMDLQGAGHPIPATGSALPFTFGGNVAHIFDRETGRNLEV